MKIKFKRYVAICTVLLMVINMVIDGLSIPVKAVMNNSQNILNNSNITVYNEGNGWYYFTEDGVKKTVYCYQHDRTQPSIYGTSGYSRVDYFSSNVSSPNTPATKEMIATVLYLGFPSNATGLQQNYGNTNGDDAKANYLTQQSIWDFIRGDVLSYLNKDEAYDYALHYYAGNTASPYFGKYGYNGDISITGDTNFEKDGDLYKTGIISVNGSYNGNFSFESLAEGIKVYDAVTNQEVKNLTTGMKIYFVYSGNIMDGSEIELSYKYQTTEIYYLIANDQSYQDLVGLDSKENQGTLKLVLPKVGKQVSHKVTKIWNDGNDQYGTRPKSIEVQLKANNENYGTPITLKDDNNWTYTWENLPEESQQGKILYSVEELGNLKDYNAIYENKDQETIITNTLTGKVSVGVRKEWIGPSADSVTINLIKDGQKIDTQVLNKDNNWQYTFNNLDKYKDGKEIEYTVEEVLINGYDSVITGDSKNGFVITNTNTEKISIPVAKKWVGTEKDSVTVRLLADGQEVEVIKLTSKEDWKHTFTNLHKYDQNTGKEILYSVKEDAVEGYDSVITGNAELGFTITNTINGKISVGVTKEWIGPSADSVTINLIKDGQKIDTQVLNKDNNWQYTFNNLDKYKDGKEIEYTVEEVLINGYDSVITGDSKNGFVITNTNTEKISIPVAKKWVGTEKDSVTVRLLADGQEVEVIKLTSKEDWKHTFTNLHKYDQNTGKEILYSVKEDAVEGYDSVITGNAELGFTITNTKITGKLEITKTDVADGKLLPNAGFRIYDENKNVIAEGYTNEEGVATFELGYGKYYYQEFDAPEGYLIDETLFPFEIKVDGEIVKAKMTNIKIAGKLEITKTDVADGKLLPNAGFRIYDENKNVIAEGYTNEEGVATFELGYGKYYYQEFDAPEGYLIDETLFPFEIKVDGEIVKAKMTNIKIAGKLEITKTDVADGKLLPNAGFRIYDENKNVIAEGYTNEEGVATFELGYGKYYYQEFDAPEGYLIDETLFPFEIKADGEIVKAKMTNIKIAGKLEITKTDVADGKLLPNAGFRVYDENKNIIAEGYTNEEGVATFELGYGKYYYQEFDAPEGYLIDETLFPFEIKEDGEIVKAKMTNKKKDIIIEDNDDKENNDNIINNGNNNNDKENNDNIINNGNNNNDKENNISILPQTGGTNSSIHIIMALIITLVGLKLFNCKYKYEK